MKTFAKVVLGIVLLLVVLIGAAAVLLPKYFDPNDYKEQIVAQVRKATGRDLSLQGDIKLTVFPWLGAEVGKVSLGNAPGFGDTPMLSANSAHLQVELLPLLRKEVRLDTITIDGANVYLVRDKSGKTNYDDLLAPKEAEPEKKFELAALALNGLNLTDASVTWDDRMKNEKYSIVDLDVKTGELAFGEDIPVSISGQFDATPKGITGDVDLKTTLTASEDLQQIALDDLDLTGNVSGKAVPGGSSDLKLAGDAKVDRKAGTANVDGLELAAFGTNLKAKVDATGIESKTPSAQGSITLESEDVPAVLRLLEKAKPELAAKLLEPFEKHAFAKSMKLDTAFDVNLEAGTAKFNDLKFTGLDTEISGNVDARNVMSNKPIASGTIALNSHNAPALIELATGKKAPANAKELMLNTGFDVDLQSGTAKFTDLDFKGLDSEIKGTVDARDVLTPAPAAKGTISMTSTNIATLLGLVSDKPVPAGAKDLKLNTAFDVDMQKGVAKLADLDARVLDSTLKGNIDARNIRSKQPAIRGNIALDSPNGPALVSLATGKPVPSPKGKLTLRTGMDIDMRQGVLKLSGLDLETFGTSVKGDIDSKGGTAGGALTMTSADVGALLTAYGQPPLPVSVTNLNATTNLSGSAQKFRLDPIKATAHVSGPSVPQGESDIALNTRADVNLEADTLSLADLSFSALGLNATGAVNATSLRKDPQLNGQLNVAEFNLRQFLTTLGKAEALPAMSDPNTLTRVAVTSGFKGSTRDLNLNGMTLQLDESKMTGDLAVADFSNPAVSFKLAIDTLNADRYLPPVQEGQAGEANAAAAPSPTDLAAAPAAASQLPLDTLRRLKIKGDASIGQLTVRKAKMANVRLSINARDGDVQLSPIAANLYGGAYSGAVGINAKGDAAVLNMKHGLQGVEIEPLLIDMKGKARLTGKGDFALDATGRGADSAAIKQTLNGQGQFRFADGKFKGLDIGQILRQTDALLEGQNPLGVTEEASTDFSELTGTFQIQNGVISNNDLLAKSPAFRVNGGGNINLVTAKVDYTILANVARTAEGQGGEELETVGRVVTVPIRCDGTLNDPSCGPDVSGLAKARMQKEIDKQLEKHTKDLPIPKDMLEGVLGGGKQPDATGAAPTEGEPAAAAKDPAKQLIEGVFGKEKPAAAAPAPEATAPVAPPPAPEATAPAPAAPPPAEGSPPPAAAPAAEASPPAADATSAAEAAPAPAAEAAPPAEQPAEAPEEQLEDAFKSLLGR